MTSTCRRRGLIADGGFDESAQVYRAGGVRLHFGSKAGSRATWLGWERNIGILGLSCFRCGLLSLPALTSWGFGERMKRYLSAFLAAAVVSTAAHAQSAPD